MSDEQLRRLERRLQRARAAQRESERIAEDALRRLYEANELKRALLGTVNHELRTPATIIAGFADYLHGAWDELSDADRRGIVARVADAGERLAVMVEDVLALAQLEIGAMVDRVEEVDLAALLDEVRARLDGGDRLAARLDCVAVVAHRGSLRRVLVELLKNALRYSPVTDPVHVTAHSDGRDVVLQVRDAGPGIALDERSRVFEPFYRGAGDHVVRTSGLGVGLSLVRRLVDLHGGEVKLEDGPGGGTAVMVRLPATPPDAVSVNGVAETGADGSDSSEGEER